MVGRNFILAAVAVSTMLAAPSAFAQGWGISIGGGRGGGGISIDSGGYGGGWGNQGWNNGWNNNGWNNNGWGNNGWGNNGWGNNGWGNGNRWGGSGVGISIGSGYRGGYGYGANRGWYGNSYDDGYGQGYYVNPGYSSGYSDGFVGSDAYIGQYQQSYSPDSGTAMPARPNFSGGEIKLRFPKDVANGKKVEYELNGHRFTMNGGDAQTFKEDRQWMIVFPTTEAAQDFKEYTLASGVYKFVRKDSGWDLVRQTAGNEPALAPTPADDLDGSRSSPAAAGVTRPGVTDSAAPRNAPGTLPDTSSEGFPTAPLPATPTPTVDGTPEPVPSAGAIDDTRPDPGADPAPPAETPQDN